MRSPDEPQGGGGSGGCGGCGGTGGLGGKGGGASFALLSFQSDIVLNACELEVSRAGDGGSGSGGQVGQIGGTGAFGSPPGCLGGNGGTGGSGGPGGGGAGGLSVGIGYVGKLPVQAHAPDPVLPSVDTPALGESAGPGAYRARSESADAGAEEVLILDAGPAPAVEGGVSDARIRVQIVQPATVGRNGLVGAVLDLSSGGK